MTVSEMKSAALRVIDDNSEFLMRTGHELFLMPETGFREHRTAAHVKRILEGIGLKVDDGIAMTGLCAKVEGRAHNANVALVGELDALILPNHPSADPITGAAHACGHHAQLTTIIGAAIALVNSGLMRQLDGDLTIFAVPAEEVIELDYRQTLKSQGKIKYLGGKQEFIRLGLLDDVDIVLCSHAASLDKKGAYFEIGHSYNGMLHKVVRFVGKSAHAAFTPHLGINALHAAVGAINNINALRDTFEEQDHVRVHYIITKGGDSPNIVPDDVQMEFGIRAATTGSMLQVNQKINDAIGMAAASIGATVKINDLGAYLPLKQDAALARLYSQNAIELIGDKDVFDRQTVHRGSSTDAGDLATMHPTIHPYFGGATGAAHTIDFDIADPYAAYVMPAKAAAMTVIDLLYDQAKVARRIKNGYQPIFKNKEEHEAYCSELFNR